jgi:hypothetical protein
MAAKLTRLAHKIAIQLHLVAETLSFAVLAPGGQSGKFGYTLEVQFQTEIVRD